ncbi:MAG TPA: flagellar brake domain-containing protein [Syntrophobacteraceae bacterium]|nr:flagellar brake domain-containing protein [Syntrophobacteraceae bacterium]
METLYRFRKIDPQAYDDLRLQVSREYTQVKMRDFFLGKPVPVEIYLPMMGRSETLSIEKVVHKDQVYEPSLHRRLAEEGIHTAFIRHEDETAFLNYFSEQVRETLHSQDLPSEKKTQLLYDNAEILIKKVFRERPTFAGVSMGRNLVESFAVHLSVDSVPSQALLSIFSKDYYTFTHSIQVAILGMSFCRFLGWSKEETVDFGLGGLFHDIGKSAVDDKILNKPGKLDKDEFELIKRHCVLGVEQLKDAHAMSREQLRVVLHHHEGMDGSGYPDGIEGPEIHRYARLARIVDCFDALTTKRPYKDAMPPAEALELMRREMSRVLDPHLFKAFASFLHLEDPVPEVFQSQRMNIELGTRVFMEGTGGVQVKTSLVGMDPDRYLIVKPPKGAGAVQPFCLGVDIICRYFHSGYVYGFRSRILHRTFTPFALLFLSYPKAVETVNLRKEPRIDCFLASEAVIAGVKHPGVIADLSTGGCRFVVGQDRDLGLPQVKVEDELIIHTRFAGDAEPKALPGRVRNLRMEKEKVILGVEFENLGPETVLHLEKCVREVLDLIL